MNIFKRVINKIKRILRKNTKAYNKESFEKELLKYDVISFDIFDTLITRKIFNPDDIFNFVENKLVGIKLKEPLIDMRKKSEAEANRVKNHDVNIDEIYFSMMDLYGYTEDEINGIKGLEVSLEKEFTYPRKVMLEILSMLVKKGKKVILTSDMYLNKNIVVELLEKCGYKEGTHYNRLYLSNDKNLRKDNGTMWKYLKVLYRNFKFVHVGDNIHSDYNLPLQYGLKAIYIENPREQLRKQQLCNYLNYSIDNRSLSDSLKLGYYTNIELFNSPFTNNITTLEDFSKIMIGPMIYEFLKYIDNNTSDKDNLLFLAREGYNLQKLYSEYCNIFDKKEKKNCYFLASRKATMSTLFSKNEDIVNSLDKDYNGSLKTLLKNVYDINYKGIDQSIKLPDDKDKIIDEVLKYSDEIIKNSQKYKDAYMKYINDTVIDQKNMVIVDLGYSGSIQYYLSKMLNKDLKGIYLTNSESVKKYSDKSNLLFTYDNNNNNDYLRIYNYSLILEYFLSAPYGQLQYFDLKDNKAVPVYNDEKMDDKKKKNNEIIYKSVVDYFKYIKELEEIVEDDSKNISFEIYRGVVETHLTDKSVKDKFSFVDSFNDSEEKNVFKIIDKY